MSAVAATASELTDQLHRAIASVGDVILGKPKQIQLAFACLLARGHLLIEDLPGVGKTTLSHTLARVLGMDFQRLQFTSDLLPADIIGVSIFDREANAFRFHQGPLFTQMLLADEINRATPKTQSALLEAMEEYQVTVDGETFALPQPFFVIATQNPQQQIGTFPLPESQLDRFLMRLTMGYPDKQAERALLSGRDRRDLIQNLTPILTPDELHRLQREVESVTISDTLIDYLHDVLLYTRDSGAYQNGLSPRAGLATLRSAQAWALLEKRDYVIPEDIQTVLPAIAGHRLHGAQERQLSAEELAKELIEAVAVPV